MKYNDVFARRANEKLRLVPPTLASLIYQAIEQLCASPATLSRRSYFPHPPQFQIFETYLEHDGERLLLKVFFQYGQDEQTLLIDDFVVIGLSRGS